MTVRAFIGLGSNLNDPVAQVMRAFAALDALPNATLAAAAPLYQNDALGPDPQPAFINSVAELETRLSPHRLLDELQTIEIAMGRVRDGTRWSPRIIDLDLLIYADLEICDKRLTLPHPDICQRRFVLLPLSDLAPDLIIPGRGSVRCELSRAPAHSMQRISSTEHALKAG